MLGQLIAEVFGTFILITFGIGVVAQAVLSKNANGSVLSINIAWGLAVMLGIYASGGVSGAHLNPAVTIALAVHRALPWNKVSTCTPATSPHSTRCGTKRRAST